MFIECPKCNKKFDVDEKLIPVSGRLVQCEAASIHGYIKVLDNEKVVYLQKIKEKDIVKKVKKTILIKKTLIQLLKI